VRSGSVCEDGAHRIRSRNVGTHRIRAEKLSLLGSEVLNGCAQDPLGKKGFSRGSEQHSHRAAPLNWTCGDPRALVGHE